MYSIYVQLPYEEDYVGGKVAARRKQRVFQFPMYKRRDRDSDRDRYLTRMHQRRYPHGCNILITFHQCGEDEFRETLQPILRRHPASVEDKWRKRWVIRYFYRYIDFIHDYLQYPVKCERTTRLGFDGAVFKLTFWSENDLILFRMTFGEDVFAENKKK